MGMLDLASNELKLIARADALKTTKTCLKKDY